jgi:uncharacterized RmlC-like cupin family protein
MTMTLDASSFEAFKTSAAAAGFDQTLLREWRANAAVDTHTHDFGVEAVVVRGEMWLTHRGRTLHLKAGDRFAVPAGEPHSERYGVEGTDIWVARRNPPSRAATRGAAAEGAPR